MEQTCKNDLEIKLSLNKIKLLLINYKVKQDFTQQAYITCLFTLIHLYIH